MANSRNSRRRRRRRRGRGGGFRVVLTFLSVLIIIGAIVAALTIFFKISTVAVTGDSRYPDQTLVAASGIEAGQNMFLFNKFTAISQIFDAHPYLDEISIRRRLPDTVEIIVTEAEPVAVLHCESKYAKPVDKGEPPAYTTREEYFLIDMKGKLLEQTAGGEGYGVPIAEGTSLINPEVGKYAVFEDDQKQKPLFLVLNSVKDHDILPNIGFIDVGETYNISFGYLDRFQVRLGTTDNLAYKLQYMDEIIKRLEAGDRGIIDVSSSETARFIRGD